MNESTAPVFDSWGYEAVPEVKPIAPPVKTPPFPDKKYSIIYADPPWSYSDKGCNGNAAEHYHTMKIEDICKLPVNTSMGGIAADDCVLFLWATYPQMKEAMKLIEAWGFKYKSIAFQWVKMNRSGNGYFFGLGRWTRGNTEPCLIAVNESPTGLAPAWAS